MLFRVPIAYKATGTLKGKKNETTNSYWEYAEVDIPVVSSDVAPTAVIWNDAVPDEMYSLHEKEAWQLTKLRDEEGKEMNWGALECPADGMHSTRLLDGQHYIAWSLGDEYRDGGKPVSVDRFVDFLDVTSKRQVLGQGYIRDSEVENPVSNTPYRDDKEFTSTFEAELAKVRSEAAKLIIVDDRVYRKSSEPALIITSYRTVGDGFTIRPRVLPRDYINKRETIHRLDSFDEVAAKCAELSEHRLIKNRTPGQMEPPIILVDEAISFDAHAENLIIAARHFAKDGISHHTRLHDVEPHFGRAFCALRIAVQDFDATGDMEAVEAAAHELVVNHRDNVRTGNLIHALESYQSRPMELHQPLGHKY